MSQKNVDLVRRLLAAQVRDDVEAALDYLHPEVDWVPLRSATEGSYRGHDGFRRFAADTFETFETFEPHFELRDLGEEVLAWGTISVRGSGSGVEIEVPVGGLFGFRDGKIGSWRDFGSQEQALAAARRPSG